MAAFLLNHVVVGVLFIPIGLTTIYCARGIREGQGWAVIVVVFKGVAVLSLPILLASVMRPEFFRAVPFSVASSLLTVGAVSMLLPLWWLRAELRASGFPGFKTPWAKK